MKHKLNIDCISPFIAENELNIDCVSLFIAENVSDLQTQDGGEARPEDLLLEQQLPFPILQVRTSFFPT